MSRRKISRNSPCPCGSGRKYKNCCYGKEFDYVEDAQGTVYREVPLPEDTLAALTDFQQSTQDELGRDLERDDLVFPESEGLEEELVQAMRDADIPPALVYAFEKTGLLIAEDNIENFSDEELEEWYDAVEEFELTNESEVEYPVGTLAYYGPDDETTTKIVAAVITQPDAEPILKRWMGTDICESPKVKEQIDDFFEHHEVTQVGGLPFNIGCPHEEGEDFPPGEDCPFCPHWKGKQGEDRWDRLMEAQLGSDWAEDDSDDEAIF